MTATAVLSDDAQRVRAALALCDRPTFPAIRRWAGLDRRSTRRALAELRATGRVETDADGLQVVYIFVR